MGTVGAESISKEIVDADENVSGGPSVFHSIVHEASFLPLDSHDPC